ncbi:hypothetical protein L6452_17514 [Arctium lappa]|uniref:Uncharacterized protein n=1 Tax=Arctium lappa TaxID=4217 RepID=A0ACB9C3L5_ARCLA|nr:hypothetical protein L6452_17514 [Arctium lappa]
MNGFFTSERSLESNNKPYHSPHPPPSSLHRLIFGTFFCNFYCDFSYLLVSDLRFCVIFGFHESLLVLMVNLLCFCFIFSFMV